MIRHKTDFGAVLLLDKRFGNEGNANKLPSWLDKSVIESNFRKGMARLAQFYHHNKYTNSAKPQAIVHEPVKSIPKKSISTVDTNAVNQPPPKKKKIILKPRQSIFNDESGEAGKLSLKH